MSRQKYRDPRGAHVRIYCSLLDSPAWRALNFSQRALYVACRRKLTSNNNGNLAFTLAGLKEQGFVASPSTLASGLRALVTVGLLAMTREGGKVTRGQAIPTLYRFTDEDCHEWVKLDIPMTRATNQWQRFSSIELALQAIEDAEKKARPSTVKAKAPLNEKKSPVRISKRGGSNFDVGTVRNSMSVTLSGIKNRTGGRNAELATSLMH